MIYSNFIEKQGNKQGSVSSSESSKSPVNMDNAGSEKDIVKPMPICNDLVYSYPSSATDSGEMKRFLFNDFVAQAAAANAGKVKFKFMFNYRIFSSIIKISNFALLTPAIHNKSL